MSRKTQIFFGAFAITAILIGALCGFVAVDLSTDRYMPDQFGPFFEIKSIGATGVEFSFMAGNYRLDMAPVEQLKREFAGYRGIIPQAPRVCAALAAEAAGYLLQSFPGH